MNAGDWRGRDLGTRTAAYDETRPILYALAVGAAADTAVGGAADTAGGVTANTPAPGPAPGSGLAARPGLDLDLVYEERLRVLPSFALTLAQWAPDALGSAGAFDVATAVHGAQRLRVRRPLPRAGELEMTARVAGVWDKGRAAVFDVVVESAYFEATWSLFAPGRGGFGGGRGPSARRPPDAPPGGRLDVRTRPEQAALYRLLGDRHAMHIDPKAARAAGMPRPFMHGLCTLAAVTLPLARSLGAHPADLVELDARFAAPVFPGDALTVTTWPQPGPVRRAALFEAAVGSTTVLSAARARFA